ncbi:MAG: aminotransferase class IV [Syntrophobacteraceae bacterium]
MSVPTSRDEPVVWLNGSYLPLSRAVISPLDRGFLYGDGVFETMRAERGRILDLGKHLERLKRSLEELRIFANESMEWERILTGLLSRNDLDRRTASVKIIVTRGITPMMGLPRSDTPTVLALSQLFDPPTETAYRTGWKLVVSRSGPAPPLARHKTLNYLYFLKARQEALDRGVDEAIILDASGNVSETAAGSLLARSHGQWWTPESPFQLPSVTLDRLMGLLAPDGHPVERRVASLADLENAETVWLVSSLTLIMPASHLEGRPLPIPAWPEAAHWRQALLAST